MMNNDDLRHIGFLISRASLAHRNIIDHQLNTSGIHRGQPPVLFALQKYDGMSNSEMAEFLGVTPATLTNKIKRMEKAGLVIRKRDPEDKRFSRIYMTEKGRGIMAQLKASVREIENKLLMGFSKDEITILRGLVQRILHNVDRYYSGMDRFKEHDTGQEKS
jgi:DNA-binding MarR family transcriptional regulator